MKGKRHAGMAPKGGCDLFGESVLDVGLRPAKPFLKWAGGKGQLLPEIEAVMPSWVHSTDFTLVEPFVGSGAVLFWALNRYPRLTRAIINDVNEDLITTYRVIAKEPDSLLKILDQMQRDYHAADGDATTQKALYYHQRERYNSRNEDPCTRAALFIFLNRTCFNGLYRVNRSNHYNVPMGSYSKPTICDRENILAVSQALQRVEILNGDYRQTLQHANQPSLFYLDPPYKPLSATSSFNSYAKSEFGDEQQIQLRDFCDELHRQGHVWILSNSDVRDSLPSPNPFFDDLYAAYTIRRVDARRNINSNADKRGSLKELLITNQTELVHDVAL
jgi:DNA adenine methylase